MKAPENQTALLKAQEQELRHAVSFAVELAQKLEPVQKWL